VTPQNDRNQGKRGGLPEGDDSLAALASTALGGPRKAAKTAPTTPPRPSGSASQSQSSSPPAPAAAPPQPRSATPAPAPAPRPATQAPDSRTADRFTQVTSIVDVDVLERFKDYQLDKKLREGKEPSNTFVVFSAINDAVKEDALDRLSKTGTEEEEVADPNAFLSIQAPGRRITRERRRTDQLSWRPTFANLDQIDELWPQHGFRDRSHFINAVLDWFLPAKKARRRTQRR